MQIGARRAGCSLVCLAVAWTACDSVTGEVDVDTRETRDARPDVSTGGCPTNWRPLVDADLGTRVRIVAGQLIMTPGAGGEVEVRSLVGATPGSGFVMRLDFPELVLGPDGRFDLVVTAPEGTVVTLVAQPGGAVLSVESFPTGSNAEMSFHTAPTHLVFEVESRPDLSLAAHAFFFEAGQGKVLETGVDRFAGGQMTPALKLAGAQAHLTLERVAAVETAGGGPIDDFTCDSLGLAFDRDAWPEVRPGRAGKSCAGDADCGAGEVCGGDDVCRRACLASSECPGSVCLVLDGAGTCRLSTESSCAELANGLVCGPDDTPRQACGDAGDCPHTADLCIGGACVSNDESDADGDGWGSCATGVERCHGDVVEVCDQGGPGWNELAHCGHGECKASGDQARCDDCVRACQGGDIYATCGGATSASLDTDCKDGLEVCSTGDDNRDPPFCRALVAPAAPAASVAVGPPPLHIDATEVTRAEYIAFLQTHPDPSLQPAKCAWNTSFQSADWPWFASPQRAVQVDYCDAAAYCQYAGKHLCPTDAWYGACSAGGTLAYPYGNTFEAGRCSNDTKRDVASSPGCTTTVVGFTGVWDLIGGVGEWLDACSDGSGASASGDTCKTRGTTPAEPCTAERQVRRDSMAGIRCCAP
ncbi:MAG: SUMF1/EgtB/PvdO family nonheme iron enzyme [Myxococcota bacterium]